MSISGQTRLEFHSCTCDWRVTIRPRTQRRKVQHNRSLCRLYRKPACKCEGYVLQVYPTCSSLGQHMPAFLSQTEFSFLRRGTVHFCKACPCSGLQENVAAFICASEGSVDLIEFGGWQAERNCFVLTAFRCRSAGNSHFLL